MSPSDEARVGAPRMEAPVWSLTRRPLQNRDDSLMTRGPGTRTRGRRRKIAGKRRIRSLAEQKPHHVFMALADGPGERGAVVLVVEGVDVRPVLEHQARVGDVATASVMVERGPALPVGPVGIEAGLDEAFQHATRGDADGRIAPAEGPAVETARDRRVGLKQQVGQGQVVAGDDLFGEIPRLRDGCAGGDGLA